MDIFIVVVRESGEEEIEWTTIIEGNVLIAVNDIHVTGDHFNDAVELLQCKTETSATKLRLRNAKMIGDFIPEKILGQGIIGVLATMELPIEEEEEVEEEISDETSTNVMTVASSVQPKDACLSSDGSGSWDEDKFSLANSSPQVSISAFEQDANGLEMVRHLDFYCNFFK